MQEVLLSQDNKKTIFFFAGSKREYILLDIKEKEYLLLFDRYTSKGLWKQWWQIELYEGTIIGINVVKVNPL